MNPERLHLRCDDAGVSRCRAFTFFFLFFFFVISLLFDMNEASHNFSNSLYFLMGTVYGRHIWLRFKLLLWGSYAARIASNHLFNASDEWSLQGNEINKYKTRPFEFRVFPKDVLREKCWLTEHSSKCNARRDREKERKKVAVKMKGWGVRVDNNWERPMSLGYSSICCYAASQAAENTSTRQTN